MLEKAAQNNFFTASPTEGYEKLGFEEKNKEKFMVTFPYPYMNGFLHLGKFISFDINILTPYLI